MQAKSNLSKSELLEWVNGLVKDFGYTYTKIQQLGNGVAYLQILDKLFPGSIAQSRLIAKPHNNYEKMQNLKMMAAVLERLSFNRHVNIESICREKYMDNLGFVQSLHSWVNSEKTSKQEGADGCRDSRLKKMNAFIPDRLTFAQEPKKSKKVDYETKVNFETKKISTSTQNIIDIEDIIHSQNYPNDEAKCEKIFQVLAYLRKEAPRVAAESAKRDQGTEIGLSGRQPIEESEMEEEKEANQQVEPTQKSSSQGLKNYKKFTINRQSMISKQVFQNCDPHEGLRTAQLQNGNQVSFSKSNEIPEAERLTDNSILINSERRSLAVSEMDLLTHPEEEDI